MTIEQAEKIVKRFETIKQFRVNHPDVYNLIGRKKWQAMMRRHLSGRKFIFIKQTKNDLALVAAKYAFRSDFANNSTQEYAAARRLGYLDEICAHMLPKNGQMKRCVYIYELPDNVRYVGLTCDLDRRHQQHLKAKTRLGQLLRSGKYKLTCNGKYLARDLAGAKEIEVINRFRSQGKNLLNVQGGGQFGGQYWPKWSDELLMIEASKYDTRINFKRYSQSAYQRARLLRILNEVCAHMLTEKASRSLGNKMAWAKRLTD